MRSNSVFIVWVPFGAALDIYDGQSKKNVKPLAFHSDNFSEAECNAKFLGGDDALFTVCGSGAGQPGSK